MMFKLFQKKHKTSEEKKDWFNQEKIGEMTIDAYETDEEIVIFSAVGGITSKDIELSLEDQMLTIKGKRKKPDQNDDKKKKYLYQECFWGGFVKKLILPKEIDISKAKATVKNGIFHLSIPKKTESTGSEEIKIEIK